MKIQEMVKNKKIIILAIAILVGGYYWYSSRKSASGQTKYVTEETKKGTLTSSISASGNVIVDSSANIDPTISGTVYNLSVNVGDKVKKGQLLFNIKNDDLGVSLNKARAALTSAQSSVITAQASKKQAQADLSSAKKDGSGKSALEKKSLEDKLDAARISETSSQQNVDSAKADLASKASDAAQRTVTSPIDGTVNAVNVKNGDDLSKLSSGSSRLVPMIIGDLGTLKAEVQVNEVDIPNVQIGQKVMMTFTAIDGLEVSGHVEKMDSLGTMSSGVVIYNVTIDFDTLDARIKPEMSVSANIITDVKQNVIVVPNSAVKTKNGSYYVEVMKSGTTPTQTGVEIGASNNTQTEIKSGLNVGDKVVTQTINTSSTSTSGSTSGTGSRNNSNNVRVPGIRGFGG